MILKPLHQPCRYGFIALCLNEFEGLSFNVIGPNGQTSVMTGQQVIENLGFADSGGIGVQLLILMGLALGFLLIANLALFAQVRRSIR